MANLADTSHRFSRQEKSTWRGVGSEVSGGDDHKSKKVKIKTPTARARGTPTVGN